MKTKTLQVASALAWDLPASVSYQAGQELRATLNLTAPEAGNYYLLGFLFDQSGNVIQDAMFGVLLPEGATYAVNDPALASLWVMDADESRDLECRFTLDRSNVTLGLFMLKMAGETADLNVDEQVGQVQTALTGPAGFDINQLFGPLLAVAMISAVIPMITKD
jgi:hypothetical protein